MLIVKIKGGLGNQMFGYAYAKALQEKGFDVKIDISGYKTYRLHGGYQLDKYNIDLALATKNEINSFGVQGLLSKIKNKFNIVNNKIMIEKSLLFDKEMLKISNNKYIDGYFQTEKYFFNIRDLIVEQFTIKSSLSKYSKFIKEQIKQSKTSISLHIRRGDYISNPDTMKIHGVCSLEYYKKAINLMNSKLQDISFFIFSDDINWVKENLKIDNITYIENKEQRMPHEDIYLMSLCNHNIIANSSFSWWGAWLNQNKGKVVIAPKIWFVDEIMGTQAKDIIPIDWIRI